MRLDPEKLFYLSLCLAGADGLLPWNPEAAELWLWALFGEDRPARARKPPKQIRTVRNLRLSMTLGFVTKSCRYSCSSGAVPEFGRSLPPSSITSLFFGMPIF